MKWISVKDDRKPLFEQDILIYVSHREYKFVVTGWYNNYGEFVLDANYLFDSVTHWMPLPEPPKD